MTLAAPTDAPDGAPAGPQTALASAVFPAGSLEGVLQAAAAAGILPAGVLLSALPLDAQAPASWGNSPRSLEEESLEGDSPRTEEEARSWRYEDLVSAVQEEDPV